MGQRRIVHPAGGGNCVCGHVGYHHRSSGDEYGNYHCTYRAYHLVRGVSQGSTCECKVYRIPKPQKTAETAQTRVGKAKAKKKKKDWFLESLTEQAEI